MAEIKLDGSQIQSEENGTVHGHQMNPVVSLLNGNFGPENGSAECFLFFIFLSKKNPPLSSQNEFYTR